MRIYVAPLGLWLTLDSGSFDTLSLNKRKHIVRIGLSAASQYNSEARLRVQQPAKVAGVGNFHPRERLTSSRDAYTVPLKNTTTWIELTDEK
jgi:hypothetical protein